MELSLFVTFVLGIAIGYYFASGLNSAARERAMLNWFRENISGLVPGESVSIIMELGKRTDAVEECVETPDDDESWRGN